MKSGEEEPFALHVSLVYVLFTVRYLEYAINYEQHFITIVNNLHHI